MTLYQIIPDSLLKMDVKLVVEHLNKSGLFIHIVWIGCSSLASKFIH